MPAPRRRRFRPPPSPLVLPDLGGAFAAIDFETADHGPDSACAVGVVRVEAGHVVRREAVLIRPPRPRVLFTAVHGITWEMVKDSPSFADVWPTLRPLLDGAAVLAAHNCAFDRRVLEACCRAAGLAAPTLPYLCTVRLARRTWGLTPNNLPAVCRRLGIGLVHHDAGSDAEACARIVMAAVGRPTVEPVPAAVPAAGSLEVPF